MQPAGRCQHPRRDLHAKSVLYGAMTPAQASFGLAAPTVSVTHPASSVSTSEDCIIVTLTYPVSLIWVFLGTIRQLVREHRSELELADSSQHALRSAQFSRAPHYNPRRAGVHYSCTRFRAADQNTYGPRASFVGRKSDSPPGSAASRAPFGAMVAESGRRRNRPAAFDRAASAILPQGSV